MQRRNNGAMDTRRRWMAVACAMGLVGPGLVEAVQQPALTAAPAADEIVTKNADARGGVEAWRKVQTMAWAGHVESANASTHRLPFMLGAKRPNKTRFEIVADRQRSTRVFDGESGWKVRVDGAGKSDVQPYSDAEARFARGAAVLDGPLMDYVARGAVISLEGLDTVDERKAYRLAVKLPSGGHQRVWIDAETYLELRHDREQRSESGQATVVSMYFRDYQDFDGLKVPTSIETRSAAGGASNKLIVERVALNPNLDDRMFARPDAAAARHRGVVIDTRQPSTAAGPAAAMQR